jgi:hypothetical protein
MSAWVLAKMLSLLVKFGLIAPSGRGGTWTEAGKALLAEG